MADGMADGMSGNRGPQVIAVVVAFPALAFLCLGLRLYTRLKITRHIFLEDYFIVVALIFSILTSVFMGYQVKNGMGRHLATVSMKEGTDSLKFLFASILAYNNSILFMKLSILLQYLRICVAPRVRLACQITVAFIIAYGVETFFAGLLTCVPVARFWDKSIKGSCISEPVLWFTNAGINIFSDFVLLALPFFILKELMLGTRQKIGLSIILSLGAFACIASICRLRALYLDTHSADVTWEGSGIAIWSSIEINVAIICTSLSVLKPLFSRILPSLRSSRNQSGGKVAKSPGRVSLSNNVSKVLTRTQDSAGKFEVMHDSECEVWALREVGTNSPEIPDTDHDTSNNMAFVGKGAMGAMGAGAGHMV